MKREKKRRKRSALIFCHDGKQFWTTQKEFWNWVKHCVVKKIGDHPLTGIFIRGDEERLVMRGHTILNTAAPHHLCEVMRSRRVTKKS
jgi:hypothetical protein